VWLGVAYLRGADVRRDDAREVVRKRNRRLTVAGGAIPGQLAPGNETGQEDKELRGIARPERRVVGSLGGKVIAAVAHADVGRQ